MRAPSTVFKRYLADDESIVNGAPGTLIDGSNRSEGVIGVTDRRVLFLSEEDRFVDVSHDAIDSIRSRPRTTFTYRGIGYRLLPAFGAFVATVSILGVRVFESSALALVLMFVTVGGTVGAEYVRRHGVDLTWTPLVEVGERLHDELGGTGTLQRYAGSALYGGNREPLVLGLGFVALTALIGLIALTGTLLVVPLALVALGGVVLTDYGDRRRRDLDEIGGSRRHERAVRIHLANGQDLSLRVDATRRIDHELSGAAREAVRTDTDPELIQS